MSYDLNAELDGSLKGLVDRVTGLTHSHQQLIQGLMDVSQALTAQNRMLSQILGAVSPDEERDESPLVNALEKLAALIGKADETLDRVEAKLDRRAGAPGGAGGR
jgi:hypothetical protein